MLSERIEDFGTGDHQTAGREFDGVIYEVRVYDDVRTQEQIMIDMVTPLDADNLSDSLVNAWQFLVDETSVVEDITSNDKDLTVVLNPAP